MTFIEDIKNELPAINAAIDGVAAEVASLAARITTGEVVSPADGQAIKDGLDAVVARLQALSVDPAAQ